MWYHIYYVIPSCVVREEQQKARTLAEKWPWSRITCLCVCGFASNPLHSKLRPPLAPQKLIANNSATGYNQSGLPIGSDKACTFQHIGQIGNSNLHFPRLSWYMNVPLKHCLFDSVLKYTKIISFSLTQVWSYWLWFSLLDLERNSWSHPFIHKGF